MCNPAGQGAERFQFARGQALLLVTFTLSRVAKEDGDAAAAWISVDFEPNSAGLITGFEFHRHSLRHDAPVIALKWRILQFGKFFPQLFAKKIIALTHE